MPEQVLVDLLLQCRVIGDIGLCKTSDRGDAEQWCDAGHLPPQVTQDLRRSVLTFLRVERSGTPTLAFRFEAVSYGTGRHRDYETARGCALQRFSGVLVRTGEFDEAMAHKRRLANEQVVGLRMALLPLYQRLTRPQASGFANHAVGDAMHHGIALPGRTGFEHRASDIPLQHMDGAAHGVCQMGELMAQETFPRARQTGEEHEPLGTGQPLQVGVEPWVCCCDEAT